MNHAWHTVLWSDLFKILESGDVAVAERVEVESCAGCPWQRVTKHPTQGPETVSYKQELGGGFAQRVDAEPACLAAR